MSLNTYEVFSNPRGREKFLEGLISEGVSPYLLQKVLKSVQSQLDAIYSFQITVADIIFQVSSETTFNNLADAWWQRSNQKDVKFLIVRTGKVVNGNDPRLLIDELQQNDILGIIN